MAAKTGAFETRWRQFGGEVEALHSQLYFGDREAQERLRSMLQSRWESRGEELRELDKIRRPGWLSGAPGLWISCSGEKKTDLFPAVGESVPDYAAARVSGLRLVRAWDDTGMFLDVPEMHGGEDGLAALAQVCRGQKILLGVDVDMDATCRDHPWMKAALNGGKGAAERYFAYETPDMPNAFEHALPGERGHFVREENGRYFMCCRKGGHYDLNYQNPQVFASVLDFLLRLCNLGVDVLYLGHVSVLWKVPGTSCQCLPETAALLRLLRLCLYIVSPAAAVVLDTEEMRWAEGISDGVEGNRWIPTLWNTLATGNTALLQNETAWRLRYPKPAVCRSLLCGSHLEWDLDYGFLQGMAWQEQSHRRYLNDWFTGRWPGSGAHGTDDGQNGILGSAENLCGGNAGTLTLLCALMLCLGEMAVIDGETFQKIREPVSKLTELLIPLRAFSEKAERRLLEAGTDEMLVLRRECDGEILYGIFHFGRNARTLELNGGQTAEDMLTDKKEDLGNIRLAPGSFCFLRCREG